MKMRGLRKAKNRTTRDRLERFPCHQQPFPFDASQFDFSELASFLHREQRAKGFRRQHRFSAREMPH